MPNAPASQTSQSPDRLGVAADQALAPHVHRHASPGHASRVFIFAFPVILLAIHGTCTFAPLRIPLFLDRPAGTYGIWMVP